MVVMWKWYFILLPKPSCSCAFLVLIYIPPTYSFIFLNVSIFIVVLHGVQVLRKWHQYSGSNNETLYVNNEEVKMKRLQLSESTVVLSM